MARRMSDAVKVLACLLLCGWYLTGTAAQDNPTSDAPVPLLRSEHPVDWWFAFKFNAETFPRSDGSKPSCLFGGKAGGSRGYFSKIGQSFVYASSENSALQQGDGFIGDSTDDPLGATFDEIYNGDFFYVVWNDQFYRDPVLQCEGSSANECGKPWGHSKGLLAWDSEGVGIVIQVTTPDWPGSGGKALPRAEGNSLGCTMSDDDVDLSQHFFALKLTEPDVLKVLAALKQEGAVTDTGNSQLVRTGGPPEIVTAVSELGSPNTDATVTSEKLSSGVRLIAKAGGLKAPPWQLVSALLNGMPLRVASFWSGSKIYSTTSKTRTSCLSKDFGSPGAIQIALTGSWNGKTIGLSGSSQKNSDGDPLGANHAKIGVSTEDGSSLTVLADMNQDGVLSGTGSACAVSQNVRGGMFFVLDDQGLHDGITKLIAGKTAPGHASAAAPNPQ